MFGTAERDALVSEALTLGAQPELHAAAAPTISYGLPYHPLQPRRRNLHARSRSTRYSATDTRPTRCSGSASRICRPMESCRSIAPMVAGRSASASIVASSRRTTGAIHSASAARCRRCFFGRDEGFYYRTWGAELKGEKDYGLINSWRLFAEQQFDATVHTEFSIAHPGGVKGELTNINAVNGNVVGLAVGHHSSYGLDPHGFRALTDLKVEGATGTFDYSRGSLQTTLSHGFGAHSMARSRSAVARRVATCRYRSSFSSAACRPCAGRGQARRSAIRSG